MAVKMTRGLYYVLKGDGVEYVGRYEGVCNAFRKTLYRFKVDRYEMVYLHKEDVKRLAKEWEIALYLLENEGGRL